jgi:hypothetical protein
MVLFSKYIKMHGPQADAKTTFLGNQFCNMVLTFNIKKIQKTCIYGRLSPHKMPPKISKDTQPSGFAFEWTAPVGTRNSYLIPSRISPGTSTVLVGFGPHLRIDVHE